MDSQTLVGRTAEVASLDRLIEELEAGTGHTVLVEGAAGIGKSRLLTELAARANSKGYLVLRGSASELERDLPFGPFVDAIDDYIVGVDERKLSRLEPDVRTELARVFPALAGSGADDGNLLQHERYRSHRAVRTLLETVATKPLVLILDDFHWADGASGELARALVRRPPDAPVLLVLAARPRTRHDVLTTELIRSEQAGMLVRIELTPLSLADTREMLGSAVAPGIAAALHEESGGVPFYLEQLVRVGGSEGGRHVDAAVPTALAELKVPPAVLAALRDELALLAEPARRVLEGASVAGDPFEPELAAAATGISEADAVDALDDLLEMDFVRPTEVPRRFRFRHPLVRRAVYEASPAAWRLGAHERTAAALAERGAAAAVRAPHVERSARQGDAAAVALLREAGDQAAGRAPATAARFYDAALRLLADNAPFEQRVELLLSQSTMLAAVGRLGDSYAAVGSAVELTVDAAPELRARTTLAFADVERLMGRHGDASKRLVEARAAIPVGSRESVALAIGLAMDGFYRLEFAAMREWARTAVADADALGDRPLQAAAYGMLALTASWSGDAAAAKEALAAAVPIVDSLTDAELAERLTAVDCLAAAESYLDRIADATRHAERTLSIARRTGQGQFLPGVEAVLGAAWALTGRLTDAHDLLNGAVEAGRLRDDDQGLAWVLMNRSDVLLMLGDVDTALADARESVELGSRIDQGPIPSWAGIRLGIALHASGDATGGIDAMTAAGGDLLEGVPGGWRVACLEALAEAQLDASRVDDARRTVDSAEASALTLRQPIASAHAQLARARLELAIDADPRAAAEAALAAVALGESAGALYDAAVARIVAGRALGEAGDKDAAIAELWRAATDLEGFGALRRRNAAEQELRRLGEHVHRRTRAAKADGVGIESLTARELEVGRLAADRLTNREIAERLFLSKKTVETHMRNLFTKLGVNSRVQVARAVEQSDRSHALE